ncbi:uncharacterized protein LOC105426221 isoform X1 [Pogonomyrmex barbatus]|uniref:Uncharacterized protein LOC105426221 isoform X1 n=1 Tax=Pogonomyrmex barbatus TaxID=144034 RepID=A0A6I9W325_9HYME|nr:uncharacterized protein LOC105426221 isoform X1 [Pogonomyrmex barbatus]
MYMIYRFFTSIIFAMINATVVLYMCQRFFRVMRAHYQIMAEADRFNSIISESRASLDYISSKVSEGMDQMKEDIAKELFITDHLTNLSSKVGLLLRRYSKLEEELIELVRMNHNMKSVRIETPTDINEEVKNLLMTARKGQSQQQPQLSDPPRTPKKLRISTNASIGSKDSQPHNFITNSRFLKSQSYEIANLSNVTMPERQERPRTPAYPEVQLLNDPRPATDEKAIGFRPSWKCNLE